MNAREMFEALGYEYYETEYSILYIANCDMDEDNISIGFGLLSHTFYAKHNCDTYDITIDEFKAIHQQLKELGWIEEETCTNKTYKKPTYKLTQCEYDMLDTIFEKEARFSKVYLIGELKKKGYFKNIKCDSNVRVKNILANCEVVG